MVLRGQQAAGSAATISISTSVIADITSSKERGVFMGANACMLMTGQAFGPVIGGALNNVWGFRSIFWLLFALGVVILSALLIFLPQTYNGQRQHPTLGIQQTLYPYAQTTNGVEASSPLAYIAWSMVKSSTTTMLLYGFPCLTEWQLGLCFLPNGLGCICGSLSSGWLLDQSFGRAQERYRLEHNMSSDELLVSKRDLPLVRARLKYMPPLSIALVISLALYGPSFEFNDLRRQFGPNLAAPLILQFLIAFAAMALLNTNPTLLIDCFPERLASATALNNLCRCLLSASSSH
ncbi:MFS general substrate transporter [Aspergillus novofumigatus IBT 16806]|uniref:MFS general substrate transporter n=1 Tax=Aspergillus novofumigatus (strain IBT 16806) TaxID=1392255 RepID=A0A2I1CEC9_ASPN1|nr:MFS general substrate transporter [Aspergillus novofumigatus IBT 16806]PKX95980.1 MFS general substrate transporter [Aspergillus novofumigatus IBT 16806]